MLPFGDFPQMRSMFRPDWATRDLDRERRRSHRDKSRRQVQVT
jgi:hypothetical protein